MPRELARPAMTDPRNQGPEFPHHGGDLAFATARHGNPPGGWYPEQRMTREEALASMTRWAAHAGFQDRVMGSLSVEKYADFTVLDRDIMTARPEDILRAHVVATYVGGRMVYREDVSPEAGRTR